MSFRDTLIRIAASCIYILRRSSLRRSDIRLVVFTGTAGKSLARQAVRQALEAHGKAVIAPPYGYTNELGIVLAMLGIDEPLRLRTWSGVTRVLTARVPRGAYVCVEVGADWRTDTAWFANRFTPRAVCLTDLDPIAWAKPFEELLNEKKQLFASMASNGKVVLGRSNPSYRALRDITQDMDREIVEFEVTGDSVLLYGKEQRTLSLDRLPAERAHREAIGMAAACMSVLEENLPSLDTLCAVYEPPPERLRIFERDGLTVIADTYKAVPYCVEQVLRHAISLDAIHRTLVLGAMRPLAFNKIDSYVRLAPLLPSFGEIYFVGPDEDFEILRSLDARVTRVRQHEYAPLATTLTSKTVPDAQLVIKGPGKYALSELVRLIEGRR